MTEMYAMLESVVVSQLERLENASHAERETALLNFGKMEPPVIHSVDDTTGVATIRIIGGLSPNGPSALARFFGYEGTAYSDIAQAADELAANPQVKEVRLRMDTPGGTVAGMDIARQALERLASEKTLIAENHGMIASAGYYLASVADSVEATSPMVKTGSIGVIVAGWDSSTAMERAGIKKIRIVSANAPDKQPDPATSSGRDVIQEMVDATERVFIAKIAEGRGLSAGFVAENFGRGSVLVAQDPDPDKPSALSVRMIDDVVSGAFTASNDPEEIDETPEGANTTDEGGRSVAQGGDGDVSGSQAAASGTHEGGVPIMDLNQLKAEHPAVYAAAVEIGINQERERVEAHIELGNAFGASDLAMSCIADGKELSPAVQAKYMAAGANKQAQGDRADESEGDLETEADSAEDSDDELAKATAELLGVESDA